MFGKIALCLIICAIAVPVSSLVLRRGFLYDTDEPIPTCPTNDPGNVTFFPAVNCSSFWECSNGRAFLAACPSSLEFNPVVLVCTEPKDSNCTGQGWSTTLIPPTTPSTTSTTTPAPTSPPTSTTVGPTWWTTGFANTAIVVK